MDGVTLTWSEFLRESLEFLKISEKLGDDWTLQQKDENEGNSYLVLKLKIVCQDDSSSDEPSTAASADVLQTEYHIVYSISYQVPMLYFRVQRSDGSMLQLEEAWLFFRDSIESGPRSRSDMLTVLTQMEHPVLFRPYLALHPCRTAALLAQAGRSANRVLTFISLMGPYVRLPQLRNEYGLSQMK